VIDKPHRKASALEEGSIVRYRRPGSRILVVDLLRNLDTT
jgi:hypothetical protein